MLVCLGEKRKKLKTDIKEKQIRVFIETVYRHRSNCRIAGNYQMKKLVVQQEDHRATAKEETI